MSNKKLKTKPQRLKTWEQVILWQHQVAERRHKERLSAALKGYKQDQELLEIMRDLINWLVEEKKKEKQYQKRRR